MKKMKGGVSQHVAMVIRRAEMNGRNTAYECFRDTIFFWVRLRILKRLAAEKLGAIDSRQLVPLDIGWFSLFR